MTQIDEKLLNETIRENAELRKKLHERETSTKGINNFLERMMADMQPQMKQLEKQVEVMKGLQPKRMETIEINGAKCQVAQTENGTISILFDDRSEADRYYNQITHKVK